MIATSGKAAADEWVPKNQGPHPYSMYGMFYLHVY